ASTLYVFPARHQLPRRISTELPRPGLGSTESAVSRNMREVGEVEGPVTNSDGGRPVPQSAPGGARTRDLPLRRRLLYPTELRRLTHRNRWPRKNRKRPRPGGTVRVRANGSGPLSSIAGSVVTRRLLQGFADGHKGHH